jgi:hypothetical protein
MDYSEPTVCLRIDPDDGSVAHEILAGPNRYEEALAFAYGQELVRGGQPIPGPYSLAAAGAIVELAYPDGALRHHVFVPQGRLEQTLLASKLFDRVRVSNRLVVLEQRRHEGGMVFVDRD